MLLVKGTEDIKINFEFSHITRHFVLRWQHGQYQVIPPGSQEESLRERVFPMLVLLWVDFIVDTSSFPVKQ